jgi:hypothetical protein
MNLLSQTGDCQLVIHAVCSQKSGRRHGHTASQLQAIRDQLQLLSRHLGHVRTGIQTITETR